jgi:hypothetical protein
LPRHLLLLYCVLLAAATAFISLLTKRLLQLLLSLFIWRVLPLHGVLATLRMWPCYHLGKHFALALLAGLNCHSVSPAHCGSARRLECACIQGLHVICRCSSNGRRRYRVTAVNKKSSLPKVSLDSAIWFYDGLATQFNSAGNVVAATAASHDVPRRKGPLQGWA